MNNVSAPFKSYCLPLLMDECAIWPLNAMNVHEIDGLLNNGFRHGLTAVGGKYNTI